MKHLLPAFLVVVLLLILLISGCSSYQGEGPGFTQRDLELQRRNSDRSQR